LPILYDWWSFFLCHLNLTFYEFVTVDGLVKRARSVTPAQAGVQNIRKTLDCGLRHNDGYGVFLTFYEAINTDTDT